MNINFNDPTLRIQTLARPLWVGRDIPTYDHNVYVYYWKDGVKMRTNLTKDKELTNDVIFAAVKEAMAFIDRCNNPETNKDDIGAFASGPIPCNNGQHGVFAFATSGETKDCANRKNDNAKVVKAYESILAFGKTEPKKKTGNFQKIASVEKKDKDDPMRIIVKVLYDGSKTEYSFRARQWHMHGEKVCVFTRDKYCNVTVVESILMKESEVKELAKSLGYPDISELYCEEAVDLSKWEEDPEYEEDIDELRAMKECFEPACDYASANRDGYIYEDKCDGNPEDYDDLPE